MQKLAKPIGTSKVGKKKERAWQEKFCRVLFLRDIVENKNVGRPHVQKVLTCS